MISRTNLHVRLRLGAGRVLWIDPRKVRFHVGTDEPATQALKDRIRAIGDGSGRLVRTSLKWARRAVHHTDSWVIAARHYADARAIESDARYAYISDLIAHRDDVRGSVWHARLCRDLAETGAAHHKQIVMRSRDEIDAFFRDYVLGLVESLERSGYDPARAGDTATALIGPDGDIHKAHNGNHRFITARILGVKPFPLLVSGVHEDWFAARVGRRMDIARLRAALRDTAERFA